jgi:hypothetical protein
VTLNWDPSPDPQFRYFNVFWTTNATTDPATWTRITTGGEAAQTAPVAKVGYTPDTQTLTAPVTSPATVTAATGQASGNLRIDLVSCNIGSTTADANALLTETYTSNGWTKLGQGYHGDAAAWLFAKNLTGSETAPTVSHSDALASFGITKLLFTGHNTTTPFDLVNGVTVLADPGNVLSHPVGSTVASDNNLLLALTTQDAATGQTGQGFTPPTGMTELSDWVTSDAASNLRSSAAVQSVAAGSYAPAFTQTAGVDDQGIQFGVAIKPAAGAGAGTGNLTTNSFVHTGRTNGTYSYYVTETNTSGQTSGRSNVASVDVVTGGTTPETTITAPANGATVTTSTPTVTFVSSISGGTFQARVDNGSFSTVTSPWTTPVLSDGTHTLTVKAITAGAVEDPTPASITITVSTTATPPAGGRTPVIPEGAAQITSRGTATANGVDASMVLTRPSTARVGDLLVWCAVSGTATRVLSGTLPAELTLISDPGTNGNSRHWVFASQYLTGDPAQYIVTLDAAATGGWIVGGVALYGFGQSGIGAVLNPGLGIRSQASSVYSTVAVTFDGPDVDSVTPGAAVLHFMGSDHDAVAAANPATPSVGTELFDAIRADNRAHVSASLEQRPAATVGDCDWTLGSGTATQATLTSIVLLPPGVDQGGSGGTPTWTTRRVVTLPFSLAGVATAVTIRVSNATVASVPATVSQVGEVHYGYGLQEVSMFGAADAAGTVAPATSVTLTYDSTARVATASWVAAAGADGYYVEQQVGTGPFVRVRQGAINDTSYSWPVPQDGLGRRARIYAVNAQGTVSAAADSSQVTIPSGTTSTLFSDAVLALGARVTNAWRLADATGTTATALVGAAGTYGGGDATKVPPFTGESPVPADLSRAHRLFDGTSYMSVPSGTTLNVADGPVTWVLAAKRTDFGPSQMTVFEKGTGGPGLAFANDKLQLYAAGSGPIVEETTVTEDTAPYLFFVEKNAGTVSIYKAGTTGSLVNVTGVVSNRTLVNTATALGVGSPTGTGSFFEGSAELYWVAGVLTAAERQSITDAWRGVAPPSPPSSITATGSVDGSGTITITWPAVASADSYNLYRGGVLIANVVDPDQATATITYLDSGRALNVLYSYTVKTVSSRVESVTAAGPVTATASNATVTASLFVRPTSLTFNQTTTTGQFGVVVSPTDPGTSEPVALVSDAPITDAMIIADPGLAYTVTQAPGASWLTVSNPTGVTPANVQVSANPTGLAAGQTYTGSLSVAVAGVIGSPQTVLVTYTAGAVVIPQPTVPTGLGGTVGAGSVSLTWNANPATQQVTSYGVFRDGLQIAAPTGTSWFDTNLTNGQTYSYQVRATNPVGTSGLSTSVLFTPTGTAPPPTPPPTSGSESPEPVDDIAAGSGWDIIVCDRQGNNLGEVLFATSRVFHFPLRGNSTASFTIDATHPLAPIVARVGSVLVKVYEQSTGARKIRFCGPVTQAERVWENGRGSVAVVASGPLWTLERRYVGENTPGATFGTSATVSLDRGELLARMIEALNGLQDNNATIIAASGDTGIRRGNISSSSSMTVTPPWIFRKASDVVAEVTASLDAPDWEIEPIEPTPDAVGLAIGRLNVAPIIGDDAPQAAWEFGTGRHNVGTFREAITADGIAQRIVVPPPGFPSGSPGEAIAYNETTEATTQSLNDYGLLESVVDSGIDSWDMRRVLAAQHGTVRARPKRVITFTPVSEDQAVAESDRRVPRLFADYKPGDFVPFRAVTPIEVIDEDGNILDYGVSPYLDVVTRVYSATVSISDVGVVSTELQVVSDV